MTKPIRMIVKLVNNQLRERREELGLSQEQLADRIGIHLHQYGGLECMRDKPIRGDGKWTRAALEIAEYFGVAVEDLFPGVVLAVAHNTVERKLDEFEVGALLESYSDRAALGPEAMLLEASEAERRNAAVVSAVRSLTPREAKILTDRFGLEGAKIRKGYTNPDGTVSREHTLDEIAAKEQRSARRIRGIEATALRKLRHPARAKALREFAK